MGAKYSRTQTNLFNDCTDFVTEGNLGTAVRWGKSLEVIMVNYQGEGKGVLYRIGNQAKDYIYAVGMQLLPQEKKKGSKTIAFTIGDKLEEGIGLYVSVSSTYKADGLRGKIENMGPHDTKKSFTRSTKKFQIIETTIVGHKPSSSYVSLFVLEMKKKLSSDDAYKVVTLAHYFLSEFAGFSLTAKFRQKEVDGIHSEVEGPIKHPRDDLWNVISDTWDTGVWSPDACSHCNGAKQTTSTKTMISHSSLKTSTSHNDNKKVRSRISQHLYYLEGPVYCYQGNGNYTYSGSKVNNGANSGDSDSRLTYKNDGGNTLNNSGNFKGNGNGGSISGDSTTASTRNSRR